MSSDASSQTAASVRRKSTATYPSSPKRSVTSRRASANFGRRCQISRSGGDGPQVRRQRMRRAAKRRRRKARDLPALTASVALKRSARTEVRKRRRSSPTVHAKRVVQAGTSAAFAKWQRPTARRSNASRSERDSRRPSRRCVGTSGNDGRAKQALISDGMLSAWQCCNE